MEVRVLLFGPQADALGRREVAITLGEDRSCEAALAALGRSWPALRPSLGASRLAVNHAFAPGQLELKPGDEVALIGLVSGG